MSAYGGSLKNLKASHLAATGAFGKRSISFFWYTLPFNSGYGACNGFRKSGEDRYRWLLSGTLRLKKIVLFPPELFLLWDERLGREGEGVGCWFERAGLKARANGDLSLRVEGQGSTLGRR